MDNQAQLPLGVGAGPGGLPNKGLVREQLPGLVPAATLLLLGHPLSFSSSHWLSETTSFVGFSLLKNRINNNFRD